MSRVHCHCCRAFMDDILGDGRSRIRERGPVPSSFCALYGTCAAALRTVVQEWLAARAAAAAAATVSGEEGAS